MTGWFPRRGAVHASGSVSDMQIPELVTERLRLRALRQQDFDDYARFMADPEVTRYLGPGVPASRADAWRGFAMHLGHWALRGFGNWGVERRSDGVFLGRVGLFEPEGWPAMEVGWTLGREHWGRGYATEAARASLDFAWERLGARRVISVIHPDNAASIAVAERIGERYERDDVVRDTTVVIYGVDRPRSIGT